MADKKNSIEEILQCTQKILNDDKDFKSDFDKIITKTPDNKVLVLNKIVYEKDSPKSFYEQSKKINEIVDHQIKNNKALSDHDFVNSDTNSENAKEKPQENYESDHDFFKKIRELESEQGNLKAVLTNALSDFRNKDYSTEISLKFDILNNQISNNINHKLQETVTSLDEKIEYKINLQSSNMNAQQQIFEERFNNKLKDLQTQITENFNELKKLINENGANSDNKINNNTNSNFDHLSKLIELQMSQVLMGRPQEHSYDKKQLNTLVADIENSEVFLDLSKKLGSLEKLYGILTELVQVVQKGTQASLDKNEEIKKLVQSQSPQQASLSEKSMTDFVNMMKSLGFKI